MRLRPVKFKIWQLIAIQLFLVFLVFQWVGRTSLRQTLDNYNPQLLTGFYGIEHNASFTYRWTGRTAQLQIPQPALRNQLTLWLLAPRASNTPPDTRILVDVFINDQTIDQLALDPAVTTPQPFTLQWQAINPFPTAHLKLRILNTFHAPDDSRELGIVMSAFEVQAFTAPGLVKGIIWPSLFSALFMVLVIGLFNGLWWYRISKLFQITLSAGPLLKILLWVSLPALVIFEPFPALLAELVILASLGLWQTIQKWHLRKTFILALPETLPQANTNIDSTDTQYKDDKAKRLQFLQLNRDNLVAVVLFGLAVIIYSFTTPNELSGSNAGSHFALLRAITERASFEIGPYLDYTMRTDYASPAPDLYYTDRPPGLVWLSVPLVGAGRLLSATSLLAPMLPILGLFKQSFSVVWYGLDWAMLVPILSGAFSVAFLFKLARLPLFGSSFKGALIASTYFGFCTLVWKYSTTFYSHVPAMSLILISVYLSLKLISDTELLPPRRQFWYKSLIALMLGYSICVDYTNILLILALLIYVANHYQFLELRRITSVVKSIYRSNRWGIFLWLSFLALISLAALAIYQAICFGSPFNTSYTYSAKWAWARSFTTTFDQPPWEGLMALYFGWGHLSQISDQGAMRGLFLLSPGLFLSLIGCYYLGKYKRKSLILLLGLIVPITLLMSAHHTYWGGGDFDARYLVVTLPYLCLPIAQWWDNFMVQGKLAYLKIFILVVIGIYSFSANVLHMLLDYPQRFSQWSGLIKVPIILPPGITLQSMQEPAYSAFYIQQGLLGLVIGLGSLIVILPFRERLGLSADPVSLELSLTLQDNRLEINQRL